MYHTNKIFVNGLMEVDRHYEEEYYNDRWEIPLCLIGGDDDGSSKRLYGSC